MSLETIIDLQRHPLSDAAFRALDKESRLKTTHDSTVYGEARASPKAFYRHHTAAISAAVASADATVLLTSTVPNVYTALK